VTVHGAVATRNPATTTVRRTGLVVVGVPTRNEAATIRSVVGMAVDGLRRAGIADDAILINADNGSSDDTPALFASAADGLRCRLMSTHQSQAGKGTNVLAIMSAALRLGAGRVILLDGDLRTVQPDWICGMLDAVDADQPMLATPVYRRNRYEGNTTNHLVNPLIRAVFGVDIEQPIAGDFAFNRAFLQHAISWPVPESAHLYGIDVHLTANAARTGLQVVQVPLGRKIHNPGFPKILFGSQQVLDALFTVIAQVDRPRGTVPARRGRRCSVDAVATRPDQDLVARFVAKARRYLEEQSRDIATLFPGLCGAPRASWGYQIDHSRWAQLLADALSALARGNAEQARDHLVPLYLNRVLTYWDEIDRLSPVEIDMLLERQCAAVVAAVDARGIRFSDSSPPWRFAAGYWAEDLR
jgi:glucosylglycerate synthase